MLHKSIDLAMLHKRQVLGVGRLIPTRVVAHALAPMPDKPFLECIARLPQPGGSLVSRPASVMSIKKASAKKQ